MNNKEFNDQIDDMIEFVLKELQHKKGDIFACPGNVDCFEKKLEAISMLKDLKYSEENSIHIEDNDVKIYKEYKEMIDDQYFSTKLKYTPLPAYLVKCLSNNHIYILRELIYVKINDLTGFNGFGRAAMKAIDLLLERFEFDIDWKCTNDLRIIDFYKPDENQAMRILKTNANNRNVI